MDNHFAPNMGFSAAALKSVADLKQAPIDAHLMIENPENFLKTFIEAGADSLTFHAEATKKLKNALTLLNQIKNELELPSNQTPLLTKLSTI